MNTFHPYAITVVQNYAMQEKIRCEAFADAWESLDSEIADACRFDAGVLYTCHHILETLKRGEEVLPEITALIRQVAELNDDREDKG